MTRGGGGALPPYPDIPSEMEKVMWTIVKEAILRAMRIEPEVVIHLAGGYARVRLSPVQADRLSRGGDVQVSHRSIVRG